MSNPVKGTGAGDDEGRPLPVEVAPACRKIRADKVERARALLASGDLGRDSNALASAIIKHLLEHS